MATFHSDKYYVKKINRIMDRATLTDANNIIEGGMCTWVVPTQTGAHTLTVMRFDPERFSQYPQEGKPVVIVKFAGDASVFNVTLRCDDGAGGYTTLFTAAADYSVTPRYVVLRVSATAGADGKPLWEIA